MIPTRVRWIPVNLSLFKNSVRLGFCLIFPLTILLGLYSTLAAYADSDKIEEPLSIREMYEAGTKALQAGDAKKALKYFEQVRAVNPNIAQLQNLIGMTHLELKESAHDAIAAFEAAIKLDPKLAEPYQHLGVIYSTIVADDDLAEEYFRDAMYYNPDFARAYFGLGWLFLVKKKQPEEAQEYLQKAVELNPEFVEGHYYLGVAYIMLNKKHLAIKPMSLLKSLPGGLDYAHTLQSMMSQEPELIREKMLGERNL